MAKDIVLVGHFLTAWQQEIFFQEIKEGQNKDKMEK